MPLCLPYRTTCFASLVSLLSVPPQSLLRVCFHISPGGWRGAIIPLLQMRRTLIHPLSLFVPKLLTCPLKVTFLLITGTMLLHTESALHSRAHVPAQSSAKFFSKGPNSKYFRLCSPRDKFQAIVQIPINKNKNQLL